MDLLVQGLLVAICVDLYMMCCGCLCGPVHDVLVAICVDLYMRCWWLFMWTWGPASTGLAGSTAVWDWGRGGEGGGQTRGRGRGH